MIYDMMISLTAIGLTPGGSCPVHTYTQTTQSDRIQEQDIHNNKNT
jgi:hypothetical protein